MKQFDIPEFYRSPIISKIKGLRKADDPRKKDFTPTLLDFGKVRFYIARHFGFCYGVENAIEIAYRAIQENPNNRIFLLSQMIHNPGVNQDLLDHGVQFLQDTEGNQLIPFDSLTSEDVVIVPAFGTTLEIKDKLDSIGVNITNYNTTCPFVEKVWNRSQKLGEDQHTIIIHGKHNHEETRATFSHSRSNAPSLVIKNLDEARFLGETILGIKSGEEFLHFFKGKYSEGFNPENDLQKIGVVNQTTMLASETQEITDYLRQIMIDKYGENSIKEHIADTRDTLCYATNDNQSATIGLMEIVADKAIVVGGYNSSNTTHLVELLEQKFRTFFIKDEHEILENNQVKSFHYQQKEISISDNFLEDGIETIAITSGASCPDAIIDRVIQKILVIKGVEKTIDEILPTII